MNSVTYLLETPFSTLDPLQQRQIQEAGRPLPLLKMANLDIVDNNTLVHYFNLEIYKKNDWICGCTKKNALYCFPCLLYGGDDYWSTSGCSNLIYLSTSIAKHELNPAHMQNMFNFSRNSIKTITGSIQEQNKNIEKNLEILDAIIDTIKCCGLNSISIFEPPEHEEESFQEMFMLFIPSDSSVKTFLQKDPFRDMESLKTDILRAASEVIREQIIEEIRGTQFLSLILESGDSLHPKIIILRYLNGCKVVERVWKIINVENINCFMDILISDLRKVIKEPTELISQSMDQLTFKLQDAPCKLYTNIQSHFLPAHLVFFYNHDILDVISRATPMRKSFRTFCAMVYSIHEFFTDVTMPEKVRTTYEEVHNRIHHMSEMRHPIEFTENKIENVYLKRAVILETMKTISKNSQDYPYYVVSLAEGFLISLQEELHNDLLEGFYKMMPHFKKIISEYENCEKPTSYSDLSIIRSILCGDIQEHQLQELPGENETLQEVEVKVENEMEIHIINLDSVKREIPETPPVTLKNTAPSTSKRKRGEESPNNKMEKYAKLMHTVINELQEFLNYRTNVFVSHIVDPRKFLQYSFQYPDHAVKTMISVLHYFSAFESMKLRTELEVLYNQPDFHSLASSCDVLRIINENNLTSTFPETVKLLKIALTFPTRTDDPKRCFDTKNKVLNFLKNSERCTNIDCLVYFYCEKELIDSIEHFNKKVLKKFVELPNRAPHFKLIQDKR